MQKLYIEVPLLTIYAITQQDNKMKEKVIFAIDSQDKELLEEKASIMRESLSEFVRKSALQRAGIIEIK